MAEKLKIIPLGGLNEIGKNMTVLEYGKDIIIVDCGLGFPDEEMYGVDLVIADMTYLVKNKDKIRGMFLTHGHEDHIGSLPYVLQQIKGHVLHSCGHGVHRIEARGASAAEYRPPVYP